LIHLGIHLDLVQILRDVRFQLLILVQKREAKFVFVRMFLYLSGGYWIRLVGLLIVMYLSNINFLRWSNQTPLIRNQYICLLILPPIIIHPNYCISLIHLQCNFLIDQTTFILKATELKLQLSFPHSLVICQIHRKFHRSFWELTLIHSCLWYLALAWYAFYPKMFIHRQLLLDCCHFRCCQEL